ncbi:transaldolase [Kineosporiaceae bacterium SCSIO 59966]|nr:transaldolase [Kineosporiaceae bacterium SCSIO 59966]
MSTALADLSRAGVAVWLDDLSRELIAGGDLQRLVDERHVVGVTSNPTIFASALAEGEQYSDQVRELVARGAGVEEVVHEITTTDVRDACDLLRPVHERTGGVDGRVSLEVDPRLARDTDATVEAARTLWKAVDRPNLFIKIPATVEGLPAITTALSEGISVNVTLIFSLDRYRAVMQAFLTGLEQAREAGRDLSTIHSVASFFVSRVDSEVDGRLDAMTVPEAAELRGRAGLANARLAYHAHREVFSTPRWQVLAEDGAHPQRPLWASTGVKDPAYPDTLYVTELVAPGTVNTMPLKTLEAVADHGEVVGDTVTGTETESARVFDALARLGVSYTDVTDQLEREGVEKFEKSWEELLATVREEMDKARAEMDKARAAMDDAPRARS